MNTVPRRHATAALLALIVLFAPAGRCLWAQVRMVGEAATAFDASGGIDSVRMTPPVRMERVTYAGDGGSIRFDLVDAEGRRVSFRITPPENAWNELGVPGNTLFIVEGVGDERPDRLPSGKAEVAAILRLIESTSNDAEARASVLGRLPALQEIPICDRSRGVEPAWYANYQEAMKQRIASFEEHEARWAAFLTCFPQAARPLLEPASGEPLSDREIASRAASVRRHFRDPAELHAACMKALGIYASEEWRSLDEPTLVLFAAIQSAAPEELLTALEQIGDDPVGRQGAARVLFDRHMHLATELADDQWNAWVVPLAEAALATGQASNCADVIATISRIESPSATRFLRHVAEKSREFSSSDAQAEARLRVRLDALAALALRNDATIADDVAEHLLEELAVEDRALMECCLARLGRPEYLRASLFELRSRRISRMALQAIERFGGRHGMDLLMGVAMQRSSRVQDEAVALASQLTGQAWIPSEQTRLTGEYAKDAAEWWQANRGVFADRLQHAP